MAREPMASHEGKLVHHRCGYPLWVRATHQFPADWSQRLGVVSSSEGDVLVEYRNGSALGIVVFICPDCYEPLQLWWDSQGRNVAMGDGDGW